MQALICLKKKNYICIKGYRLKWFGHVKRREATSKIRETMDWQPRERQKKTLDRWGKTRLRKVRNYELGRVGLGSRKLESIDRSGKNSYRVMKPHDDTINIYT
jgi:hypothetical protein